MRGAEGKMEFIVIEGLSLRMVGKWVAVGVKWRLTGIREMIWRNLVFLLTRRVGLLRVLFSRHGNVTLRTAIWPIAKK